MKPPKKNSSSHQKIKCPRKPKALRRKTEVKGSLGTVDDDMVYIDDWLNVNFKPTVKETMDFIGGDMDLNHNHICF